MLSCKEVTKLVSENLDRHLPLWRRLGLRLHVAMCKGCSAYRRQIESLNKLVSDHYRSDQAANNRNDLPDGALARIKESLHTDQSGPS